MQRRQKEVGKTDQHAGVLENSQDSEYGRDRRRAGTLDDPDLPPPDVHIFTASKQPWVVIPAGTPAFEAYYERESLWPPASLARRAAILPLIEALEEHDDVKEVYSNAEFPDSALAA